MVQNAQAAGFSPAASMNVARSLHTATLLSNGTVLVAGGEMDGGAVLTSAEIYDPVANTWTVVASLNNGRKRHTATLLSNGTVLVAGGLGDSGTLATCEIYDPVAGTWANSSTMNSPRQDHTATVLPNGKVLVAGGDKQTGTSGAPVALTSAEFFDPSSGGWTATPSMARAHFYHSAVLLQNNKVLIVSGDVVLTGMLPTTTNTGELYDYASNVWSAGGILGTGRAQFIALPIAFPKILVAGGINGTSRLSSAELFDSQATTFTGTGALNTARNLHTGTVLNSGQVLVAGGFDGINSLTSAETYDPVAAQWNSAGALAAGRKSHTATLLSNGKVLLAGGINQIELSSVEIYDPGATGPLTLTSAPVASPNPGTAGQNITFSATATGGSGQLTYTWSFGDSGTGTGPSVTHVYAAAGTYAAAVTVTDAASASVSGSVNVIVNASGGVHSVVVGTGADNDMDGFSNVDENAFGSDPNNPNSLPLGVTNVNAPQLLAVSHLQTRLVFNRGNRDYIRLNGFLLMPDGFTFTGAKVGIDVGGVPYLAILDARGRSGSVFKLDIRYDHGVPIPTRLVPFTLTLQYGSFSRALAASGLTNGDFVKVNRTITVSILFNSLLYQVHQPQRWSARLGHYGSSH